MIRWAVFGLNGKALGTFLAVLAGNANADRPLVTIIYVDFSGKVVSEYADSLRLEPI